MENFIVNLRDNSNSDDEIILAVPKYTIDIIRKKQLDLMEEASYIHKIVLSFTFPEVMPDELSIVETWLE